MRFLLVTLALVAAVSARKITFDDCGAGEVKSVDVEPCPSEPCMFKKGQEVTMTAQAVASTDSKGGNLKVTVELGGVEVEYPGIDPDICKIVTCPIKKGQTYDIVYKITAEDYFPDIVTTMKWDVQGDNGRLLCASSKVGIAP